MYVYNHIGSHLGSFFQYSGVLLKTSDSILFGGGCFLHVRLEEENYILVPSSTSRRPSCYLQNYVISIGRRESSRSAMISILGRCSAKFPERIRYCVLRLSLHEYDWICIVTLLNLQSRESGWISRVLIGVTLVLKIIMREKKRGSRNTDLQTIHWVFNSVTPFLYFF